MNQDVLIIGAGIVGMSQALSLVRMGLEVTLCDRRLPQTQHPSNMDSRVYAITPASQQLFQKLGIWDDILAARVSPYRKMAVWDESGDGSIHFDCQEAGLANLGYIIEHHVIVNALLSALSQYPKVQFLHANELSKIVYEKDSIVLHTDIHALRSKLLIGADGANSWLRKAAGIEVRTWEYGQRAIVATVTCEQSHDATARQCFMPRGPVALLPLDDDKQCSIVWSTETEHSQRLMELSNEAFCDALSEVFSSYVGAITQVSERIDFPLKMQHAHAYTAERVALIGDAIHTIHPLAGQGLNLGLSDCIALSASVEAALDSNKAYFHTRVLRRFERARKAPNWQMILLMEAFKRLFGSEHKSLIALRNKGLSLCDSKVMIKQLFIERAVGF